MHIAVLGATSQIARDFITTADNKAEYDFSLYARRPSAVKEWVAQNQLLHIKQVGDYDSFKSNSSFNAVINFVGVGDPAAAQNMGSSILDTTHEFDTLALNYLQNRPETRYIFLSSGAAYGSDFDQAVTEETPAQFNINMLKAQDWYGIAKFYAECRHRALKNLPIIDIRVFSYFSRTQDISARFLMSDVVRAIRDKSVLETSSNDIVRAFFHPSDFFSLVRSVLEVPFFNEAVDCYTRAPISKSELLAAMQSHFGLRYQTLKAPVGVNSTGTKLNYYSRNLRASGYGYQPSLTSWDGLLMETAAILSGADR